MGFKILFLDDSIDRINCFIASIDLLQKENPALFNVDNLKIVQTSRATIDELRKDNFDLIFLDHDLGGEIFVDPKGKETGSEVARVVARENLQPQAKIIVHSFNYVAACDMINIMHRGIHCPGVWKYQILKTTMGFLYPTQK